MCLIHSLKAETKLSNGWLKNIYEKNSDGIGAMMHVDGKLVVKKFVPKNLRRAMKWYRQHVEGHEAIVHWRFATHGTVDMDNCHPYKVLDRDEDGCEMYLAHNGVLDAFNEDTELEDIRDEGGYGWKRKLGTRVTDNRSDTYHFIRSLLLPMLKPSLGGDPSVINNRAVQMLIANKIGYGNKLVIGTDTDFIYINGQEFTKWPYYGLWVSNEYAWDADSGAFETPQPKKVIVKGDPRLHMNGNALNDTGMLPYAVNDYALKDHSALTFTPYTKPASWQPRQFALPMHNDEQEYRGYCQKITTKYNDLVAEFPNVGAELTSDNLIEYADNEDLSILDDLLTALRSQEITDNEFVDLVFQSVRM